MENETDHVDFVWIDDAGGLWRVMMRGSAERLHYWNSMSMSWVPLRTTRHPEDDWMAEEPRLPQEQAALYNFMSASHGGPG